MPSTPSGDAYGYIVVGIAGAMLLVAAALMVLCAVASGRAERRAAELRRQAADVPPWPDAGSYLPSDWDASS